jgi:hypothetical protein
MHPALSCNGQARRVGARARAASAPHSVDELRSLVHGEGENSFFFLVFPPKARHHVMPGTLREIANKAEFDETLAGAGDQVPAKWAVERSRGRARPHFVAATLACPS